MKALLKSFQVVVSLVLLAMGMASCAKETEIVDPYADWQGVNKVFIDSIASVCANPPEGEVWEKYLDYRISAEKNPGDLLEPYNPKTEDYVYVKYASENDVYRDFESNPLIMACDTVVVAFQGFLVNGTRFDGSYYGTFDKEVTDGFASFGLGDGVINGWTTALLRFKPQTEDKVDVYIPYQLAYGTSGRNSIPGYSVLKFEMYVDDVVKPGKQ